jgi:putative membrane-bound dehydrogenase-like protein
MSGIAGSAGQPALRVQPRPIKVLLLGDDREPHPAAAFYSLLAPALARRGIQITTALAPRTVLDAGRLAHYDAVMLYGDAASPDPEQAPALAAFVESGKGLVAMHAASSMFPSSQTFGALIGGRMQAAGSGEFRGEIVGQDHPAVKGVQPFVTWDETYVSAPETSGDRTVLMERADGPRREPLAWVRSQGRGRVFYTTYGHDRRTWSNPEFQKLVEQAVRWTVSEPARQAWEALKMPALTWVDGFNVPNYEERNPPPLYQLPLTPRESMQYIQAPAEFTVELFASEPDIVKPISFSFDERGRLWVIESVDYPNQELGGGLGNDRIKILEDTDGDGRADKVTIFADHLNIPTSLTFANGGVIVTQTPDILFLKDTDGDGKADVRQVLSTGWGTRDTHAQPSNLQYAPDNYIWGVVGYSGFDGVMNGKRMQFSQGVYRFRPDGSGFEFLTGSTNNTWGLGFSETFDAFGSTANNDPSFYLAIPNRYFNTPEGLPASIAGGRSLGPGYQSAAAFYAVHHVTPYIRQVDVHGGYTAAAGHHLYTARAFPKEYWNRVAFITEPTAHLVGQGIVENQGAGVVTRDGWNLMAGSEEWVAPVHAEVGPDGAVWVADWYNFIAQHNPTPPGYSNGRGNAYETSLRDHMRGRIYRIAYRNAPPAKRWSLSKNDPAGLVAALSADNMFWRLTAQRLIVERGQKDVVPQLVALVRNIAVDAIGTNGGALHALWTLEGLGALADPGGEAYRAALGALKHPAAGVRKAAAMVLPKSAAAAAAVVDAGLLADPDLHTRLAATLVLADMPPSAPLGAALYAATRVPENYTDRWLSRALFIAATRHRDAFLPLYKADPAAVPIAELPLPLRLGALKPDWRVPRPSELGAWRDMQVPGNWESRGLPDFDGVVWFTRAFAWSAGSTDATISLGRIGNAAEVWVNGLSVTPAAAPGAGRGGGRGAAPPAYAVPAGTLKTGENVLTVRITNGRNEGGFLGTPDSMHVDAPGQQLPLAGTWKFQVERQTNAGALYSKPGELSAHVALGAAGAGAAGAPASLPPAVVQAPDVVLRLGVVRGQMKFDTSELIATAGQLVEVVLVNGDEMPHNFVLGAMGSLDEVGLAADKVATAPGGPALQYVPDVPQVLAASRLVDPGQTATIRFRAPAQAGTYPFVCTFPGHWRVMNGVLKVIEKR